MSSATITLVENVKAVYLRRPMKLLKFGDKPVIHRQRRAFGLVTHINFSVERKQGKTYFTLYTGHSPLF